MTRLMSFVFAAPLLVACVGGRQLGDGQHCPCAPGWFCDSTTNLCLAGSDGGGAVDAPNDGWPDRLWVGVSDASAGRAYSPDEVQAALAQCDLAHGPVATFATYGDKRALMVGSWIQCPPPTPMTVFSPAIAFAAEGIWNRLLPDGNGGLVVGYGVDNQGSYGFPLADSQPANGVMYVDVAAASGDSRPVSFSDGPITFEMSPARLHATVSYSSQPLIEVWLVHLP